MKCSEICWYTVKYSKIRFNTVKYGEIQTNTLKYSKLHWNTLKYIEIEWKAVTEAAVRLMHLPLMHWLLLHCYLHIIIYSDWSCTPHCSALHCTVHIIIECNTISSYTQFSHCTLHQNHAARTSASSQWIIALQLHCTVHINDRCILSLKLKWLKSNERHFKSETCPLGLLLPLQFFITHTMSLPNI